MKKLSVIFLICLLFLPVFVFAQTNPCSSGNNESPITALPKCINQVYTWALGAAALLALLMIILGGYYVMTSQGNGEQATKGKEFIYSAIIGLVILFSAYLLLRTINPDLVNFNLDSVTNTNQAAPAANPDMIDVNP